MVARAEAVSVILPVLNERDNLEPLHARLTAALKPLGRDYEIVFVDDGSTDGSWDVMKRLVASDRAVRLVRLRRNFGQTAALAAASPTRATPSSSPSTPISRTIPRTSRACWPCSTRATTSSAAGAARDTTRG